MKQLQRDLFDQQQSEWVWYKSKVWKVVFIDKQGNYHLAHAQDYSLGVTAKPEQIRPVDVKTRNAIEYFTGE